MAFITFEEETGMQTALLNNHRDFELLGSSMVFNRPNSPTDIIWENRERKNMFARYAKATVALISLLICSFVIVYTISTYEQALKDMFPSVDCDFIE